MLINEINDEIIPALSQERFLSYERLFEQIVPSHATSSNYRKVKFYLEIQQLYSYFYLPMQILEITLRNRIHKEASIYYKSKLWLPLLRIDNDSPLILKRKTTAIEKQTQEDFLKKFRPIVPEDYIARITFGFWVGLFHTDFRQSKFLQFHTNSIFPNKRKAKLSYIYGKLLQIQLNRNRLYHYEPIWTNDRRFNSIEELCNFLIGQYDTTLELLFFCSKNQKRLLEENKKHFSKKVLKFKLNFHC